MSSTVKRSAFKTFLNTGTVAVPVWSLIGDGIVTGAINYNPQTLEEVYIHQDSGTTEIESYKPTLPIEATCKAGDAAFDYIDNLRQTRAVLDAAKTEIVNVWLYETANPGPPITYPAEKQTVSIQIDTFGGEGGKSNKINYTINFLGDPTQGKFDPVGLTFTANP